MSSHSPRLLDIVYAPAPVLAQKAAPIESVSADITSLLDNMIHTMYAKEGIGLAAPQVSEGVRVFVMDCTEDKTRPFKMINPEIIKPSEEQNVFQEGCLSIPGVYGELERPSEVLLRYIDETGTQHEQTFNGLEARCIQHELDHLNGVLFIDYYDKFRRRIMLKESHEHLKNHKLL